MTKLIARLVPNPILSRLQRTVRIAFDAGGEVALPSVAVHKQGGSNELLCVRFDRVRVERFSFIYVARHVSEDMWRVLLRGVKERQPYVCWLFRLFTPHKIFQKRIVMGRSLARLSPYVQDPVSVFSSAPPTC